MKGSTLSGLFSAYRDLAGTIVALGFICYGLSIGKQLVMNHEGVKGKVITYIVALCIFLTIWALLA